MSRMICRLVAWVLLILHFFVHEPYREQVLAIQTLVCVLCKDLKPLHIVTFFVIIIYFVETHHVWLLWSQCVHHAVVACCIVGEYYVKDWNFWPWLLLCWSIRWLSSVNMYDQIPVRASLRCIIFGLVAQKRFAKTFKDGFKWCWILLVHEAMWILLPCQMLFEIYKKKKPGVESVV